MMFAMVLFGALSSGQQGPGEWLQLLEGILRTPLCCGGVCPQALNPLRSND